MQEEMRPVYDSNGWMLAGHDPELQRTLWVGLDDNGNQVWQSRQEVGGLLDLNKQEKNAPENKKRRFREWEKVASVPLVLDTKHLSEANDQKDDAYIRRFLNDPDNAHLRTFRNRS